ncbi:MAG TPA: galactitol-1-phosphate 5-dehydrogenase [Edaphobacter sp.]|uniref:galactitol-1-phosphate 5-dehydrogenase n=1 Tax=Edaphobacter sp. TaxID=1934404 RepID=UPI002CF2572B|nr:galactitol-1-phosphate 5-dehydrogenase [Edaphobacter sp.]HUZ93524.1 galactitol-1-phosphate 5-dehydrogenase [Edaphobacter sp.]
MQALVLENYRDLQIREVPEPELGPSDVLVKVKACGICGSDVHGYDGKTGRRVPPLIMGHEAAGVIARVGTQVRSFYIGDRVTFDSTISCGQCRFCEMGSVNLCDHRQVLGVSCDDYRRHGAFAEYVAVPEHIVYRLPPAFSFEKAALIEAVSIAVHAAKITEIRPDSSVLVVGAGMIGLLAIQAFRVFGCKRVFAIDLEESKLEIARQLGADETFPATDPNLASRLKAVNGCEEVDIAVDVVGGQHSINSAISHVRRGGTVTLIGNLAPAVEIPLQSVVTRQLRLLGSCASAGEYGECISLMESGAIKVAPLISVLAPLREGAEWFERLYRREPGLMKVILQP